MAIKNSCYNVLSTFVDNIIVFNCRLSDALDIYNLFYFQTSYNISDSVLVAVWSWRADSSGT